MKTLMMAIALAIGLAGCAHGGVGSVAGGDCAIAHTPAYAVKGRTGYDQTWVDDTTERLVEGCQQPRPQARPASLDPPKAKPPVVAKAKPRVVARIVPAVVQPETPAPWPEPEIEPAPLPTAPAVAPAPPTTTKTKWWHWKFWWI